MQFFFSYAGAFFSFFANRAAEWERVCALQYISLTLSNRSALVALKKKSWLRHTHTLEASVGVT